MTAPLDAPTRQPWRQALHDWVNRGRRPQAQHVLRQRNIYVLPSGAGCMLAVTLLALLVASINFQLNLGYLLTFLLTGSALSSLWIGHRNLRGLQLQVGALQPVFQGQRVEVPVQLQIAANAQPRHGISLALNCTHGALAWAHTDVEPGQISSVTLSSTPHRRGWHRLPRVVVESRFPIGIFRLWSYWQPQARVLVYPRPEADAPALTPGEAQANSDAARSRATASGSQMPDGVRAYRSGDAMRSIVWKKAAHALATGSAALVVRDHPPGDHRTVWLDARSTGLADTEAQIARLTAWVLQAQAQSLQWGLRLPSGRQLPPGQGEPHLQQCLRALAVDGMPDSQK